MKRVTLLRHAKSSWKEPFGSDFDRPLNGRGKRDAPLMGQRLAARGFEPDLIVTSPARRAIKTARAVADELGRRREDILEEKSIYEAGREELVELIRLLGEETAHVLLVGHNPGFTDLANYLGDRRIVNVPTCGAVDMEFDVPSWEKVGRRGGRVAFFDYPKKEPA